MSSKRSSKSFKEVALRVFDIAHHGSLVAVNIKVLIVLRHNVDDQSAFFCDFGSFDKLLNSVSIILYANHYLCSWWYYLSA